ncbi:MAG: HU family DNA-binding protein [Alysiella sp.]|uniref:HU family DNA-binding protein n=1 Tax=Alysiella sp. TaxID=1872483 RepID=UPI0026DBBD5C|nr:HU family DNA-binding protein [Alysiella sp.]MDO4434711.1 HU family DNA-binding protein [Alysiella sp.]
MNKSELIEAIAERAATSKKQAENMLNSFCYAVADELERGGEVNITGFGSFTVAERAERAGRNPKTGEPITIAASKTVKFKAGKSLKDTVA